MRLTYPTALVLQALLDGHHHGFDIMDATGLPSGTVYPILRRLDAEGCVRSRWEKEGVARREQRPPRRYYELTAGGKADGARRAPARAGDGRSRQAIAAPGGKRGRNVAPSPSLTRAIALVGLASRLVPRGCATTGAREWEGELTAADPQTPRRRRGRSAKADLVRHALGSFVDAFWIRQRDVADLRPSTTCATAGGSCGSTRGFAFTAVGILALSMAASVVAFSVVSQILLRPLPYPDADRIVTVWERQLTAPGGSTSAPATSSTGARARRASRISPRRSVQLRLHRRRSSRSVARA